MIDYHPLFLSSTVYHVYNHANGTDDFFREEDNYRFFLKKYIKYISPVVDTLAYCLMKNHFHLMVRVKDSKTFKTSKVFENLGGLEKTISKKVSQSFSTFLIPIPKRLIKNIIVLEVCLLQMSNVKPSPTIITSVA